MPEPIYGQVGQVVVPNDMSTQYRSRLGGPWTLIIRPTIFMSTMATMMNTIPISAWETMILAKASMRGPRMGRRTPTVKSNGDVNRRKINSL
jgi:hypothetical protein